jgi:putative endonuclease
MINYRITKGKEGEEFVADYLKKHGFTLLTQNYRKQYGEVDLIALNGETLAFVEVKWRRNPLIDPAEIITLSKQKKIIRIAKEFLSKHTELDVVCRFDVAIVEEYNNSQKLRYIANAFTILDEFY